MNPDQEAAVWAALHGLINDMHHALGRIALACFLLAPFPFIEGVIHLAETRWTSAALDAFAFVSLLVMGAETTKRRRKYRPAIEGTR